MAFTHEFFNNPVCASMFEHVSSSIRTGIWYDGKCGVARAMCLS